MSNYGRSFPLFHLTKDADEDTLKVHYYNENGTQESIPDNIIIKNYKNEKITLTAETRRNRDEVIRITVRDENNNVVFCKDLSFIFHKYAQLFAWGDRNDYEISIKKLYSN